MIIIPSKDKDRSIYSLDQVLRLFLFPGLPQTNIDLVRQHLSWMQRQGDMRVKCRLETLPASKSTRIVLDIDFDSLPQYPKH